jgi:hypothetical protein
MGCVICGIVECIFGLLVRKVHFPSQEMWKWLMTYGSMFDATLVCQIGQVPVQGSASIASQHQRLQCIKLADCVVYKVIVYVVVIGYKVIVYVVILHNENSY